MPAQVPQEEGHIGIAHKARVLIPSRIVAFYKLEGLDSSTYIETAKVDRKGRVLSFAPMSTKQVHSMADAMLTNKYRSDVRTVAAGWISDRFLHIGVEGKQVSIMWKRDAGEAEVAYSPELKIPNGIIATPPMIFCYSHLNGNFYVWACKEFKGRKTILYHLPFHNVYENGRVCMGRSSTKFLAKDTFDTYCNRWEYLFFNTAGSEIHHMNGFPTNINTLHRSLRKGQPFPMDKLIEYQRLDKVTKDYEP